MFGHADLKCDWDDQYYDSLLEEGVDAMASLREEIKSSGSWAPIYRDRISVIDAEVGDDLIAVSNNPHYLRNRERVLSQILGMKVSDKDTSINSGMGNFAESLVWLPREYDDTWLSQKSLRRPEEMGFIDIPKVRLITNTRQQRQVFSSTDLGKASDMANILSWTDRFSPFQGVMQIASLMQDALLGATSARQCAYLPNAFGGCGKLPPFWNYQNFVTFLETWKCGRNSTVITTVMRQTTAFMRSCATFQRQAKVPKLLEHFTRVDPVFTNWVKDERSLTVSTDMSVDAYRHLQVGEMSYGSIDSSIAPRLAAKGLVVTETKLKIALQHNELSEALVSAETFKGRLKALELARANWRKNPLNDLNIDEIKSEVSLAPITEADAYHFFTAVKDVREIRKIIQREAVFKRCALDEVYRRGPMLVKDSFELSMVGHGHQLYVTEGSYGKDGENPSESKDLEELYQWYIGDQKTDPPQVLIEDDNVIVNMASKSPAANISIVTDDIKLCKRVANTTGKPVLRIPVEYYYRQTYFADGVPFEQIQRDVRLPGTWENYEDSGSIQSGEEKYFLDGELYPDGTAHVQRSYDDHWSTKGGRRDCDPLDFEKVNDYPQGFPGRHLFRWNKGRKAFKREHIPR